MEINKEVKEMKRIHARFMRAANRLDAPENLRLLLDEKKSASYYYAVERGQKNDRRHYLGKENDPVVRRMKERRFLEAALAVMEKKIAEAEQFLAGFEPFDAEAVNAGLPKAYRLSAQQLDAVTGTDAGKKWQQEALARKARLDNRLGVWHQEELKHAANNGVMMRSKSEVIVANLLLAFGILFVYELPVKIDGTWLRPDFTIWSPRTGKIIIWEHLGMLHSEKYLQDFAFKMDKYLKAGRVPGVDLLFSFDDLKGHLNAASIKTMIEALLLDDAA